MSCVLEVSETFCLVSFLQLINEITINNVIRSFGFIIGQDIFLIFFPNF